MARRRPPAEGHDPSRREFFREFGRQTLQNAGAVAGAAAELRRTSVAAARELLELDPLAPPDAPSLMTARSVPAEAPSPDPTFRSAYRFTGESLVILDQRELPARTVTFETHEPSEIASAMRTGAVTAGPVLGQVAAYAIVLVASRAAGREPAGREQLVKAAFDALRAARADVHALVAALARMEKVYDELVNQAVDAPDLRERLLAEADAITVEATADHAAIGEHAAATLRAAGSKTDTLQLLMHGDAGPLSCGLVGMGTAVLQLLRHDDWQVHVWTPAAAPSEEGSRLTALELTQLDVPHTILPDAAVGWLFANRSIDGVLLRGDTICANGDTTALLGARSVAELARAAKVPLHVLAAATAFDPATADAAPLVLDIRSPAERGSAGRGRINPTVDVVPIELTSGYITAGGVIAAPPDAED